jgi:hypothetical protein
MMRGEIHLLSLFLSFLHFAMNQFGYHKNSELSKGSTSLCKGVLKEVAIPLTEVLFFYGVRDTCPHYSLTPR